MGVAEAFGGMGLRDLAWPDFGAGGPLFLFAGLRADAARGAFWALRGCVLGGEGGEVLGLIGAENGAGRRRWLKNIVHVIRGPHDLTRGDSEGMCSACWRLGRVFTEELTPGRGRTTYQAGQLLGMKEARG